ncbi:MAG: hypothetical protein COB49_12495 [Alphaproteobacteria bacterium]|nr:MAG: hypothetical protein COB49_12495 [Alphaproteobacteria bacterium]
MSESLTQFSKQIFLKSLIVGTVSAGTLLNASVMAEEQSSENVFSLEEIVVTARKRTESLQDTPISISAFSGSTLQAANITGIDEIANMTPGLVFDTTTSISGSANSASVFIRGIGQTDFTLVTEPGVGIYVDDAYLSHSIGNSIDALDIERVEVLRGPQGTLFGRNTIGGAIRVVTKKPDDEIAGDVELILGEYSRVDLKAHLNLPLSDELLIRLSALSQNRDGYIERPFLGDTTGDKDTTTVVGQLRWLASEDFTADLMVTYLRDRSNGSPNVLLAARAGGPRGNFHNPNVAPGLVDEFGDLAFWGPNQVNDCRCVDNTNVRLDQDLDAWSATLNLEWQLENIGIRSISYFRDLKTNFGRDAGHAPFLIVSTDSFINLQQWSQELQFTGQMFEDKLSWIGGVYYFKENGFMDDDVRFNTFELLSGGEIDTESYAIYGQTTYDATEQLHLTFGARYSDETKKFLVEGNRQVLSSNGVAVQPLFRIIPAIEFITSSSGVDLYGNISFDVTEDMMVYGSYSEGFKGGGFVQRNPPSVGAQIAAAIAAGGTASDVLGFGPEKAQVYELGAKLSAFDNRLRLTAAVFHTDYSDIQVTVTEGVASITKNAGQADINGVEFELTALPVEGLFLSAGLAYLDASYASLSGAAREVTLDSKLPHVPEWQLNGTVAYDIPFSTGSLTPRVDWSYSSEMFNDARNSESLKRDAYHLVNLSLTYRNDSVDWEAAVFVKNVGDTQFITSGFESITDYAEGSISRPREWGVRVTRSF